MSGRQQSPLDRALSLCPSDAARLELTRLGAELNLGASSPEWIIIVLYAEARGIFGASVDTDHTELFARLERIDSRIKSGSHQFIQNGSPLRDLLIFTFSILLCIVTAVVVGAASVPWAGLLASFALGLSAALIYSWAISAISQQYGMKR